MNKKIHNMTLDIEPFDKIDKELKTIELRLFDQKRKKINVNDYIIFTLRDNLNSKIEVKVLDIITSSDFKSLYKIIDLRKLGYNQGELEEASYFDMSKYYKKEEIEKYGVVGYEIIKI